MPPQITYKKSDNVWRNFVYYIVGIIERHNVKRVCEVGGGANPLLGIDIIADKNLEYTVLDVSEEELEKAPHVYRKVRADICSPEFAVSGSHDLVFSRMLAEHIADPVQFHRNILELLAPGGFAAHCFPTLYALPFWVNRLLPDRAAKALLNIIAPRNAYRYGKFPAYYRWCRGPSERQVRRFTHLGYEVVEYRAFLGHPEYYKRLPLIQKIHNAKTEFLLKHPHPFFTSYAYVLLRKPEAS